MIAAVDQQVEQPRTIVLIEYSPESTELEDCSGFGAKMLEVGQANAVDPGRQAARPIPPDQSTYIEQDLTLAHQTGDRRGRSGLLLWDEQSRTPLRRVCTGRIDWSRDGRHVALGQKPFDAVLNQNFDG